MEPTNNGQPRRKPNPRRRRVSRVKRILRAYLPVVGVLALIVLFIIFAVNSVKRADAKREEARKESIALEESLAQVKLELEEKARELVKEADGFAAACEFDKAIAHLDSFEGNPDEFDVIKEARDRYEFAETALVPVEDITKTKFLTFGTLLPDTSAFSGEDAEGYRLGYITGNEFTRILQELFDGGYMLVDFYDLFTTTQTEKGSTLIVKNELRLPQGKKPIVFICKATGTLSPDDPLSTESVGFISLLEAFIESNPGFSYKGSRAILATTAHDGIFGHALTDTAAITKIAKTLTDNGYLIACNSYGNLPYGRTKLQDLKDDISNWNLSATPLLGPTELMFYARSSDIDDSKEAYYGDKYEVLYDAGFRYYFGVCYNSNPWMNITDNTIRIGTITVNGENLTQKTAFFEGLFEPSKVVED